jgi:hypothetical protein
MSDPLTCVSIALLFAMLVLSVFLHGYRYELKNLGYYKSLLKVQIVGGIILIVLGIAGLING